MNRSKTYHYQTPANRTLLRKQSVERVEQGEAVKVIAGELGVCIQTIYNWIDLKDKAPKRGLDHHRRGPASRLRPQQRKQLASMLVEGAMAHGFPTNLWTLDRIAQLIETQFHVRFDPSTIWRILDQMNFSCQKPERRARERDPKKIRSWRRRFERLKKKPSSRARH